MVKKIQLNDEQWMRLVTLANRSGTEANAKPNHFSARLRSHGFVSQDSRGCETLTEQGWHRLTQGR